MSFDVGKRIKLLREKQGISNRQLAKKAGLSQPVMNRIENNQRTADVIVLQKICNALEITLSDFFAPGKEQAMPKEYKLLIKNAKYLSSEQLKKLNEFLETLN